MAAFSCWRSFASGGWRLGFLSTTVFLLLPAALTACHVAARSWEQLQRLDRSDLTERKMSAEPVTRSEVFGQLRKELYGEEPSTGSDTHIFIILGASVSINRQRSICFHIPKESISRWMKLRGEQKTNNAWGEGGLVVGGMCLDLTYSTYLCGNDTDSLQSCTVSKKCAESTYFIVSQWKARCLWQSSGACVDSFFHSFALPACYLHFVGLVVCSKVQHCTTTTQSTLSAHFCFSCKYDAFSVQTITTYFWCPILGLFAQGDLAKKKIYPTLWYVTVLELQPLCVLGGVWPLARVPTGCLGLTMSLL